MVVDSKTSGIIVTVVFVIMAFRMIYLYVKSEKLISAKLRVRFLEAACIIGMELWAAVFYFGDQQLFKKSIDLTTTSGIIFLVLFLIPVIITIADTIKDTRKG